MSERVKCIKPGCEITIQIATAKRNDGLCGPCHGKQKSEEYKKYIEANRKEVNLYEGVTDPVEVIIIAQTRRSFDPLITYTPYPKSIEQLYHELSEEDEHRLVQHLIDQAKNEKLETLEEKLETIGLSLIAFRDVNLSQLLSLIISRYIYYPSILFKSANEEVVASLIEKLNEEEEDTNGVLCALVWTSSERIAQLFSEWKTNPPVWVKDIFVQPSCYAHEAGWALSTDGVRTPLYFDTCYQLVPNHSDQPPPDLSTCTASDQRCEWCNRLLVNFVEIDMTQQKFDFIPTHHQILKITTCQVCALFTEGLFMEIASNGEPCWSKFNERPDYLPDPKEDWGELPSDCLKMSDQTRLAHCSADPCTPTGFSQIGGMPTWEQRAAYPSCPRCKDTMKFITQLSMNDIQEYGEGIYYSFLCARCDITATNYQQT